MAELSKVYIDSYNYFVLCAEETGVDTANNRSSVHAWMDLYVAGHVASSGIRVGITGSGEVSYGYHNWTAGTYRLIDGYYTADHNEDGSGWSRVTSYFYSYIGNWDLEGTLTLTKINRQSRIDSFTTGTYLEDAMKVTFTKYNSSYTQKLRISIPNVMAIETAGYNVSGEEYKISSTGLKKIYDYCDSNKLESITIGAVIETYNGGTKIGESSELTHTFTITSGGRLYINGAYKRASLYVYNNGWKRATAYVYNNGWKRGN